MYRCKKTIVEGNQIGTSKTAGTTISVEGLSAVTLRSSTTTYTYRITAGVYMLVLPVPMSATSLGKVSNFNANYIEVLDEGVGTKGVFKTPTFENRGRTPPTQPIKSQGS